MTDGDGTADAEPGTRQASPDGSATTQETNRREGLSVDEKTDPEPAIERASTETTTAETVDIAALTGPEQALHPSVRYIWLLQATISALVVGSMVGVPAFIVLDQPLVGPTIFLLLFSVGSILAILRYRRWSYKVRKESLFLDRGVITETKTVVPYVRIQHVDTSRGPIERALGLATAVVYTAGSRGADVSIPGLTPTDADDLQNRLKQLAISAEGEDAV
jgi:membrane protein YdbS with pleckstrin-like domain